METRGSWALSALIEDEELRSAIADDLAEASNFFGVAGNTLEHANIRHALLSNAGPLLALALELSQLQTFSECGSLRDRARELVAAVLFGESSSKERGT